MSIKTNLNNRTDTRLDLLENKRANRKNNINRVIIVSDKIKDYLSLQNDFYFDIIKTNNITREVSRLINSKKKDRFTIFAVIFIHIKELDAIDAFLKGKYDYARISYRIVVFGPEGDLENINDNILKHISDIRTSNISAKELNILIRKAFLNIEGFFTYKAQVDEDFNLLQDMRRDQEDLINIGRSLSTEKDQDELLKRILMISKKITGADAGSIYLVEKKDQNSKHLRFKYSHTFSKRLPMEEFTLPINKDSIAGYVATTGEVLNIPDVYQLTADDPISHNPSFDRTNNYISKSMLVVPMTNYIDEIIGVIQLLNSKDFPDNKKSQTGNEAFEIKLKTPEDFEEKVVPFDARYESLMESVAGQAAIAIENNRMIDQIQNQFEEFVKASVIAVESRDIATSGHSFRVATICTEMAKAINIETGGPFKNIDFKITEIKELEFAALLHDFGKVYIDVNIFKKAKKLYSHDLQNLILRLNYIYKFVELSYALKEGQILLKRSLHDNYIDELEKLRKEEKCRLKSLLKIKERLIKLNEPTVTEKDPKDILFDIQHELEGIIIYDIDGNKIELITENEKANLEIQRGSLNIYERKEIESHVMHTYNFVNTIPWPPEFENIPAIVLSHHEKLDGTGYPNSSQGKEKIPIQSRIMAIADIFDALIAADRPYKKAIKREVALKILEEEAERNKLDKDLFNIFTKYQIYKKIKKNTRKINRKDR